MGGCVGVGRGGGKPSFHAGHFMTPTGPSYPPPPCPYHNVRYGVYNIRLWPCGYFLYTGRKRGWAVNGTYTRTMSARPSAWSANVVYHRSNGYYQQWLCVGLWQGSTRISQLFWHDLHWHSNDWHTSLTDRSFSSGSFANMCIMNDLGSQTYGKLTLHYNII